MVKTSFCVLLAAAGVVAAAPDVDRDTRELPFEIASNKPFVQVAVNGSPKQWFILDTGCAGTSVVAKECAERIGLAGGAERQGARLGAGDGVRVGIATVTGVTLEVGGQSTEFPELRIFPLGHVAPFEGRRVDGLLGQDFMERNVVEIDYARNRIRLIDPDTYVPPAGGISVSLDIDDGLAVTTGSMTLRGGEPIPCRLVIDTGVRATVIFYRPFVIEHELLDAPGSLVNAVIGGGVGGETRGDIARLELLRLGRTRFAEPVGIFSRDTVGVFASDRHDGIIGGELLRRCKTTFDYPHRRLILEPYTGAVAAFEYDMSGLFLVGEGEAFERIVVLSVTRGTPAADAGLRRGDQIVSIDGKRSPGLTLAEARDILRTPGTRRLEIRRGGRSMQVTLATRRLV